MSKSLSTSTLSLRFMQNAHRAKQMKEVELDRAEVKDDGKWEVSQVVRDSWGIARDETGDSDIHEPSYLPFLFSDKDNSVATDFPQVSRGRRVFNKKGEELLLKAVLPETEAEAGESVSGPSSAATQSSSRRKIHPRPISISAASGTHGQLRGFESPKEDKDSKTARQAIFESSGVGSDLRSRSQKSSQPFTSFLKPSGVDDPKEMKTPSASAEKDKKKREREPELVGDEKDDVKKTKRKKKKNKEEL